MDFKTYGLVKKINRWTLNENMKKISIIIATYNADKVLQRCLNSIRHQKTEKVELLIIDGNSKDKTMEIVNKNKDIIDYTVSEPDKGIYDAWNKGIKASSGEWIQFLGSDDMLLDGAIVFYLDYLNKEPGLDQYDIIFGRCWMVDEKGKRLRVMGGEYSWEQFRHYMRLSHGSALHNRHLFEKVGLFSLQFRICADYELLLRKILNAKYVDREIIAMQIGGMSNSIAGLVDTFRVKQYRKSAPTICNIYYLVKGFIGYYFKKLYVNKKTED